MAESAQGWKECHPRVRRVSVTPATGLMQLLATSHAVYRYRLGPGGIAAPLVERPRLHRWIRLLALGLRNVLDFGLARTHPSPHLRSAQHSLRFNARGLRQQPHPSHILRHPPLAVQLALTLQHQCRR